LVCIASILSKEDQSWTREQAKGIFTAKTFSEDDLLPEQDKGKRFEKSQDSPEAKALKQFVQASPKKEPLEGTEPLFTSARSVLDAPGKAVGITATTHQVIPAEEHIEKCQEAGNFQVSFIQQRSVEITPEVTRTAKHCQGHEIKKDFFWETSASTCVKQEKYDFDRSPSVSWYQVEIVSGGLFSNYVVSMQWKHHDDTKTCNHFSMETVVVEPTKEIDRWSASYPERLSAVEANPYCKLLYAQPLNTPGTRTIGGREIFRDSWERQLFFSCESQADSLCARFRKQGGVLLKRKCLQENEFGDCELWEKTYDLGKQAAQQKTVHHFEGKELIGFNNGFDASYEKNTDLGHAVASLSVFSDIKKDFENKNSDISQAEVFHGDSLECSCSFLQGVLYDCCRKMEGLAVAAHLARCTAEEQSLAERRQHGLCHFVGSKRERLGTQTSQVFCCFPTKLARIVQEQGRTQLGIGWGTAEEPKCRGYSIEELTRLDFSTIDLSEVAETLAIDKEELLAKVRTTMNHLQAEGPIDAPRNTGQIVQQERVQHGQ